MTWGGEGEKGFPSNYGRIILPGRRAFPPKKKRGGSHSLSSLKTEEGKTAKMARNSWEKKGGKKLRNGM